MKFEYTKWPVTITFEVSEDWFDGIEEDSIDRDTVEFKELKDATEQASDYLIAARGILLARQEAKRKQTKED